MALVWDYGERTGLKGWKGLSWGMVPLLGGAMCACTWHFFYNSESLEVLVALQGALTVIGNITMCIAAFRIFKASQESSKTLAVVMVNQVHESWTGQPVSMTKFAAAMTNGALPMSHGLQGEATESGGRTDDVGSGGWRADDDGGGGSPAGAAAARWGSGEQPVRYP
uniref:Uncharacterized protein n=1 Tax=Oryza barthii TaxID=65489 RepID=A0A0D3FUY5_9ORYZ